MLAPSSGLLRAGLALKMRQLKLATRSYVRDRTNQATSTLAGYAVASGLFAAAGVFLIAACLVGIMALFRWIEIHYGLFPAFGAIAALLLAMAAVLAAAAASQLQRRSPDFPTLTSRLRVAIRANPLVPDQIEDVRNSAGRILRASPPATDRYRARSRAALPARNKRDIGTGLILVATLLGWAVVRRRQQARPPAA